MRPATRIHDKISTVNAKDFVKINIFSFFNQKAMEEEEEEEEETETKPDPLHQLILHFSRTALTEKT